MTSRNRDDPPKMAAKPEAPPDAFQDLGDAAPVRQHIYIDVSDLVFYIGHHDHLTGIQRVQSCLILEMARLFPPNASIIYLSWDRVRLSFRQLEPTSFIQILRDCWRPSGQRATRFDKDAAKMGILPMSTPLEGRSNPHGTAVILLLGAAWVNDDYFFQISKLKRSLSARFVCVMHDLIPVFARETCDQGTAEVFMRFLEQAIGFTDLFICVSENTRRDLDRFASENGLPAPTARVVPHAAQFVPDDEMIVASRSTRDDSMAVMDDRADDPGHRARSEFVLLVSTIEGRKNHKLAYYVWRRLLAQHGPGTPKLVCVGRFGWRAEGFIRDIVGSDYLGGKIEVRTDISDQELENLYRDCLFTFYPSFYEGWGLPISESLSKGKLCVCSGTSSMPEAGGPFAIYIDPHDSEATFEVIHDLLTNRDRIIFSERRIAENFRPRKWAEAAAEYFRHISELKPATAREFHVSITLGEEYPIKALPAGFGSQLGDQLFSSVSRAYTGLMSRAGRTPRHIIDGQALRGRGVWMAPEEFGTWLGIHGASLEFVWDGSAETSLVVLIAYRVLSPFAARDVIYRANGIETRLAAVLSPDGNYSLHTLRLVVVPGVNQLDISMDITERHEQASRAIDGRGLMLAICSMMFFDHQDHHGRLRTYELLLQREGFVDERR